MNRKFIYMISLISLLNITPVSANNIIIKSEPKSILIPKTSTEQVVPKVWAINPSINPGEWTNKTIELEIEAQDFSNTGLQYSFDNGTTYQTSNKKLFDRNQEVKIKVKDGKGQVSETVYYQINNIDKTPPPKPEFKLYTTEDNKEYKTDGKWANKEVTLETTNRPTGLIQGESPIDYMFIEVKEGNQTLTLRETSLNKYKIRNMNSNSVRVGYVDKAGNKSLLTEPVTIKVDTEPPVIHHHWTSYNPSNVYVAETCELGLSPGAVTDNLSKVVDLSLDGGETWTTKYNLQDGWEMTVTEGKNFKMVVRDEAGNISNMRSQDIQASTQGPIIHGYHQYPDKNTWTNQDVTVEPYGDKKGSHIYVMQLGDKPVNWNTDWNGSGKFKISENINTTIKIYNRARKVSQNSYPLVISNIDKIPPTVTNITPVKTDASKAEFRVTGEDKPSGLHSTPYSIDGGNTWQSSNLFTVNKGSTKDIVVRDKATNNSSTVKVSYLLNGGFYVSPVIDLGDFKGGWTNKEVRINITPGRLATQQGTDLIQSITENERYANTRVRVVEYDRTGKTQKRVVHDFNPYPKGREILMNVTGYYKLEVHTKNKLNNLTQTEIIDIPIDLEPIKVIPKINFLQKTPTGIVEMPGVGIPTKWPVKLKVTNLDEAEKESFSGIKGFISVNDRGEEYAFSTDPYYPSDYFNEHGTLRRSFINNAGTISPRQDTTHNTRQQVFQDRGLDFSTKAITDKPVKVTITRNKPYYRGFSEQGVSRLYRYEDEKDFLDTFTPEKLNNEIVDESKIISFLKPDSLSTNRNLLTHTFTVDRNGTYYYYLRAYEGIVGRFSFTVDNIDLLPPKINSITKSTDAYTQEPIVVTINAEDDVGPIYYSFDGGQTYSEDNTITIKENQSLDIKVKDAKGRETTRGKYEIKNIDFNAPIITSLGTVNNIENKSVDVTMNVMDIGEAGLPTDYISINNSPYSSQNTITAKYGSKTPIKLRDKVYNTSDMVLSVSPAGQATISPVISGNIPSGQFTSENVSLSIGGAVLPTGQVDSYYYSFDNGRSWSRYNPEQGLTISMEGSHDIIAKAKDNHGNEAISEPYEVRISRTVPVIQDIIIPTGWANKGEIKVIATNVVNHIDKYSFDGGVTWQSESALPITENRNYQILVKDKLGLTSQPSTVGFHKYDPHPPKEPTVNITGIPFEEQEITITDIADLPTETSMQSGIKSVAISINNQEEIEWTGEPIKINETQSNLPIVVKVEDNAGNITKVQQIANINIIDVEVNITNEFIKTSDNEYETAIKIQNRGTPIRTKLKVNDSKAIPLILDRNTSWANLTKEETKQKAQLIIPTLEDNDTILNKDELDNKVLLSGLNPFVEMKAGEETIKLILNTGSSLTKSKTFSYDLELIVESKY